jgi:hypothetical protein
VSIFLTVAFRITWGQDSAKIDSMVAPDIVQLMLNLRCLPPPLVFR